MINLVTAVSRPNRVDSQNKDNDQKYHADFAKYCISNGYGSIHSEWVDRIKLNKDFYKGKQWTKEEDVEAFLKDDTGNVRNRIKVVQNIIRPMVEQYRGNALRLVVNATASSISPNAKTRMDQALEEKFFYTKLANETPTFSEYTRQRYNVGKNNLETMQIFDNTYVDLYSDKITKLVKHIAKKNKIVDMQIKLAENVAFSGLAAVKNYEYSGDLRTDVLESERVFFDRSARKPDLSDSTYVGYLDLTDPSELFERFQDTIDPKARIAIENYVIHGSSFNNYYKGNVVESGRIPVYNVFWRDVEVEEWGYVMDKYGYLKLERINYTIPGQDAPLYTDKDLVAPPETKFARRNFKGKMKKRCYVDVLRYCIMTPAEVLTVDAKEVPDVIYEFGLYYDQYRRNLEPATINFPIKFYTWAYIDGEILSPTDDAIDPQRLINRITSVVESQVNQSGGSNVVIDKSAVDAQDGEDTLMSDINSGKPITLNTKGRGVPNSVGTYDATPKAGTYALFNLVSGLKSSVKDMTGVNEALNGESMGSEQLVGVTKMMIQRGSLMQEPFYHAIVSCLLQTFEYYANEGKNIYIDNDRELSIMTGDDGAELLKLDPNMKLEDMRIFVKRENVDEMLYQQADQMLMVLRKEGLIDDKIFSNLFGRSTPSEVGMNLRTFAKEKAEVSRVSADKEKEAMAMQSQMAQQDSQRKIGEYAAQRNVDADAEIKKMREKTSLDINKDVAGAFISMQANGGKK